MSLQTSRSLLLRNWDRFHTKHLPVEISLHSASNSKFLLLLLSKWLEIWDKKMCKFSDLWNLDLFCFGRQKVGVGVLTWVWEWWFSIEPFIVWVALIKNRRLFASQQVSFWLEVANPGNIDYTRAGLTNVAITRERGHGSQFSKKQATSFEYAHRLRQS